MIKYKLLPRARKPERMTEGASCWDIAAVLDEDLILWPQMIYTVATGIILEVPPGLEGQIRSRSGWAQKGIVVANAPGTIDADYRGEVRVILANIGSEYKVVKHGDRIAQIGFCAIARVPLWPVSTLSSTERGAGGFGSTGSR